MPIINGTGNGETLNGTAGQDSLYGLGGDDSLFGLGDHDLLDGGEGRDRLEGGTGSDRYFVDDALDVVVEGTGEGDDALHSSVDYALAAGVSVETMTTLNAAGTSPLNLTGNELAQSIYGNAGNNVLNGGGGTDNLVGRAGNDIYLVDSREDRIVEALAEGDDRLVSSSNYILAAGVNVETMGTADAASAAMLHLTGNEFGQSIYGSAGENWLSGLGGSDYLVGLEGNDILWGGEGGDWLAGGSGADIFTFRSGEGVDVILDFASGSDEINLGHFLAASQFVFIGSAEFTQAEWYAEGRFADGRFELDVNGDAIADLTIVVQGNLASTDFIFRTDIGHGLGGWENSGFGEWDY